MNQARLGGAVTALVLAAGCSSAAPRHTSAAPTHPATSGASVTLPIGCGQVKVVVGSVRGELKGAPGHHAYLLAEHQLSRLSRSIPAKPPSTLHSDVYRTSFELSEYVQSLSRGQNRTYWANAFAADLARLDHDCGS